MGACNALPSVLRRGWHSNLKIDLEATDRFREKTIMGKPAGSAKLNSRALVQACRVVNKRKKESARALLC